jgi:DNA-binding transcriptional LysR family regulator
VLPHIMDGRLELVLDEFRANDEPIWAVYPQRRHLLPKVRKLVDRLRAELGPALDPDSSELPAEAAPKKPRGAKR